MKAFLLAAGHGTRLRPITDEIPKCLAPIRGRPILDIWLSQCERWGIHEVLINLHAKAPSVRAHLTSYTGPVHTVVTEEPELLGSAGTIRANATWIQDEQSFWIFYADVLFQLDLKTVEDAHTQSKSLATIVLSRVTNPTQCGIATVSPTGKVEAFEEKPAIPKGNLGFTGILIGSPQMLDFIPAISAPDIGFDLLPKLAGKMSAVIMEGYLRDIGNIESYQAAQNDWPGIHPAPNSTLCP